jgi:hypothetical protein
VSKQFGVAGKDGARGVHGGLVERGGRPGRGVIVLQHPDRGPDGIDGGLSCFGGDHAGLNAAERWAGLNNVDRVVDQFGECIDSIVIGRQENLAHRFDG